MLHIQPRPKPKPVKVLKGKKKKRKSLFCSCKHFWVNREDYKTCAHCKKPLREKDFRKALEFISDGMVREVVLKRDQFCVCSAPRNGHTNILQCGHLISRGRVSVRYDLRNCNTQCDGCNARHEHFAEIYTVWFIREFGVETYQSLVEDSEVVKKLSVEELQILCDELTAIRARQDVDKDFKPRYSQAEILSGAWRIENDNKKDTLHEMYQWPGLGHSGTSGDRQHYQEG